MRWRTVGRIAATVFLALVVTGAVAAVGIAGAYGEIYSARDPSAPSVPVDAVAAPTHDPGKPTAVVVLGPEVANAADVLAPYEVLAATGAFNLYTVAPERQPVPLTGGLDLVPDLSLGQLDQRLPEGPEVVVVPQLSEVAAGLPPSVAPVVGWLRRQGAEGDPLLVGVCVGAQVLAEAGLLEGRPATSHWLGLIGLRRDYPGVRWTDGVRYVDDGDVITTAGVLSGVDGALRVVERMVGRDAAARAARAVAWPAYSPGGPAPIERSRPAPADVVAVLSAGYRWDPANHGGPAHRWGRGDRAGLGVPALHRAVVPGPPGRGDHRRTPGPVPARPDLRPPGGPGQRRPKVGPAGGARRRRGPARGCRGAVAARGAGPMYLHDQPGFAFDAALVDIARTRDVATARWVAKTLQYPTSDPRLSGPAWPWGLTLRPILLAAAAAIAAVLGIRFLGRRRRGAFRGGDRAAPPAQPADTSSNVDPSFQLTRRRS